MHSARRGAGAAFGAPVLALTLVASGCTTFQPRDPAEVVNARATDFVAAVRAAEYATAYELTTPAYRSVTTVKRFASEYAGAPNWTDASVSRVDCEEQRCEVRLMISYRLVRPPITNTRPLDQVWVQVEGDWYLYPDG